jgi:hypothetical protein
MENTDIHPILLKAIVNLYKNNNTRIKIDSKLTGKFLTMKGL